MRGVFHNNLEEFLTTIDAKDFNELAISQSCRGLGLVVCLDGQKIYNMPNMASRKLSRKHS